MFGGNLDVVRSELVFASKVASFEIMRNGPSVKKRLEGWIIVILSLEEFVQSVLGKLGSLVMFPSTC